jgi:hypothetical protein
MNYCPVAGRISETQSQPIDMIIIMVASFDIYLVHKSQPLVLIKTQMNPVCILNCKVLFIIKSSVLY